MRTFIVVGHKATTTPDFSLEDIPGTSGRLDILCRCINAAFVISHGIRHDVRILLVLCGGEPHKTICLRGEDLRHLNPDERTTAALLKKALAIVAGPEWSMSTILPRPACSRVRAAQALRIPSANHRIGRQTPRRQRSRGGARERRQRVDTGRDSAAGAPVSLAAVAPGQCVMAGW